MLNEQLKVKLVKKISKVLFCSLLSLSFLQQNSLSSQPMQCEEELCCDNNCCPNMLYWGAAAIGAGVGGVIAATTTRHGKKGKRGSSGSPGDPGSAGIPGPVGPAGSSFSFATGPASLTFTFDNSADIPLIAATDGPNYLPLIIKPDQTVITGVVMPPDAPTQVITIPSPAQIGVYQIVFYLVSDEGEVNSEPSVVVTNSLNAEETYFNFYNGGDADGTQYTFSFTYSPSIIP